MLSQPESMATLRATDQLRQLQALLNAEPMGDTHGDCDLSSDVDELQSNKNGIVATDR